MAPKYTAVPSTDEDDSSLSTPDPDNKGRNRVLRLCVFVTLASSIATNLFFLFLPHQPAHDRQCPSTLSPPPLSPSSSWNIIWGEVPMVTSTWQSYTAYAEPGEEASGLWHDLLNPAQGLIRIPSPRLRALPPSYRIPNDTDSAEIYMTSGAHQLHCLTMLRTFVSAHSAPNQSTPPPRSSPISFAPRATHHQSHTPIPHLHHCLDYLRQATLCTADTTLEVVDYVVPIGADGRGDEDNAGFEVDSAATSRTCRDWSVMRGVMEEFGIQVRPER